MQKLVKLILIVILLACGILVAATALLQFVDLDPYRDRIAGMVSRAIGRQVEIRGHMEINLFPHPEVILNEVSLANAKWGSDPTMVRIKHLDAAISFPSLLSDTILLRRVRLNEVGVLLEKDDHQVGNWVLSPPSTPTEKKETGPPAGKAAGLPVMVDLAEFSDITITLRDPEQSDRVFRIAAFNLQPDESGNLLLRSSGELMGYPMALNCKITSRESLHEEGAVNFGLQVSLGDAKITGQISTSRLATLAELRGTFHIGVEDIQKILKTEKIDAPLTGPLTVDATIHRDGTVYKTSVGATVEGITTTVEGTSTGNEIKLVSALAPLKRAGELSGLQGLSADALTLKAKVTRSDADTFSIDQLQADVGKSRLTAKGSVRVDGDAKLSLTLTSPDLKRFFEPMPAVDFEAKAVVQNSADAIAVSDLAVNVDKSDISGDFTLSKGDKPAITAKLTSNILDLRPFSRSSEPSDKVNQEPPAGADDSSQTGNLKPKERYLFKETPLELAVLEAAEADVNLSVKHFYHDAIALTDAVVAAAAHDGQLDAKFKFDSANAGHAAGKIDLRTHGKQATIATLLSLTNFRVSVLKHEGINPAEVPPVSVSLDLKTAGASPRQLAAGANGRILLTQGSGKLKNTLLKTVSNDVFAQLISALNPFARKDEFSKWDCTVVSINIVDGLADIDTLLAQGEKVMIVGDGGIDLKTETLNLEFNTKPRSGVGVSADMFVAPFVKVGGTLASPGIGLNKKGTLLAGGAAVATGGLSILLKGLYDRATAEGDQCEKALKYVGKHTRYSF